MIRHSEFIRILRFFHFKQSNWNSLNIVILRAQLKLKIVQKFKYWLQGQLNNEISGTEIGCKLQIENQIHLFSEKKIIVKWYHLEMCCEFNRNRS